MGQYALLMAGIVIGGIAVAGIRGIMGYVKSRAMRQKTERIEQVITSVEEKWLDVENLVRLFRSGRLNPAAFSESLDERIESINRLYKPVIHQLDIFFVKYTEKMIEEYRDLNTPAALKAPMAPAATCFEEASPSQAPVEIPAVAATLMEATLPAQEIDLPVQEDEQVISEMTEAAATDSNLQLESFLEMEPSVPVTETFEQLQESDEIAKASETRGTPADSGMELKPEVDPESASAFKDETPLTQEGFAELQHQEPYAVVPETGEATSFVPQLRPGIEAGAFESEESETIIQSPESPFSFSGRVSSTQAYEPVLPSPVLPSEIPSNVPPSPEMQLPTHPFALPSRPHLHKAPLAPAFKNEEIAHPATIYDVEAETIIVDRSTIMGVQRPAVAPAAPATDKNSIGITGEDVSDAFDAFFGPGKK